MFTGVASKAPSTVEVLEEVQPGDGKRFPKTGDKVVIRGQASPQVGGARDDGPRLGERGRHGFTFDI